MKESMDICRSKLNNSIIPFQQDPEMLIKYVAWYKNTTGGRCKRIWTPLSDQTEEGLFLNMNDNTTVESPAWDNGKPDGGKDENFVVIDLDKGAEGVLNDVPEINKLSCSSCLLSSFLLLKLDGLCKDSLIGKRFQ